MARKKVINFYIDEERALARLDALVSARLQKVRDLTFKGGPRALEDRAPPRGDSLARFADILRDHPVDPDAPHIVPASRPSRRSTTPGTTRPRSVDRLAPELAVSVELKTSSTSPTGLSDFHFIREEAETQTTTNQPRRPSAL